MTKKYIGIWMDHSVAHLIELTNGLIITNNIESEATRQGKEDTLKRSENLAHNKEQQQQSAFYKKIISSITNCEGILLFGPTTAKSELLNLLKANHHFENIKIQVKNADNMTENQQQAFVKEHFHLTPIHQN